MIVQKANRGHKNKPVFWLDFCAGSELCGGCGHSGSRLSEDRWWQRAGRPLQQSRYQRIQNVKYCKTNRLYLVSGASYTG